MRKHVVTRSNMAVSCASLLLSPKMFLKCLQKWYISTRINKRVSVLISLRKKNKKKNLSKKKIYRHFWRFWMFVVYFQSWIHKPFQVSELYQLHFELRRWISHFSLNFFSPTVFYRWSICLAFGWPCGWSKCFGERCWCSDFTVWSVVAVPRLTSQSICS